MGRKLKRTFPKRDSAGYIKTDRFDANRAAAYNAQRSPAVTGPADKKEHNPRSGWMSDIPPTKGKVKTINVEYKSGAQEGIVYRIETITLDKSKLKENQKTKPQEELFTIYKRWASEHGRQSGCSEFYRQKICVIGELVAWLLFSGTEFLVVQEYGGLRKISYTYSTREEAINRYNNNTVVWRDKQSF